MEKLIGNPREDSLTASVFATLLHLPSETFWRILRDACYTKDLPDDPGEPKVIEWPRWYAKDTGNVIPDLVISFAKFDLMVEAKRWDNGMQDPEQWRREFAAYIETHAKQKEVRLLALGGIHSEEDQKLRHESSVCTVHMCRWSTVLLECQREKRSLGERSLTAASSRILSDIRILDDLIALLGLHGYPALQWFDDLDFKPNLLDLDSVDPAQRWFQNVSHTFRSLYVSRQQTK